MPFNVVVGYHMFLSLGLSGGSMDLRIICTLHRYTVPQPRRPRLELNPYSVYPITCYRFFYALYRIRN